MKIKQFDLNYLDRFQVLCLLMVVILLHNAFTTNEDAIHELAKRFVNL